MRPCYVLIVTLAMLLLCSLLSLACAQGLPVKVSVGKSSSAKDSYTIKIHLGNPKGSSYSIQSVDIALAGQDMTKCRAPPARSAKYQKGAVSFVSKSPLKAGASAVFEISSFAPIYSFRWNVASVGGGTYVDFRIKNTNISWPSAGIQRNYK